MKRSSALQRGRILAIANQKGGVGKSMTAEAFATILKDKGYSVLIVDLDDQKANMTFHILGEDRNESDDIVGTYDVLDQRSFDPERVRMCVSDAGPFGMALFATRELGDLDVILEIRGARDGGRLSYLARALDVLRSDYDFIVVDTPPSSNLRTKNALAAADDVIIAATPDSDSIKGMVSLVDEMEAVRSEAGAVGEVAGVVVTMFDTRRPVSDPKGEEGIRVMADILGIPVFKTHIRKSVAARNARNAREPICSVRSAATDDYQSVVGEYLAKRGSKLKEGAANV